MHWKEKTDIYKRIRGRELLEGRLSDVIDLLWPTDDDHPFVK